MHQQWQSSLLYKINSRISLPPSLWHDDTIVCVTCTSQQILCMPKSIDKATSLIVKYNSQLLKILMQIYTLINNKSKT